jgi:hypothetical protein
MKRLLLPFLLGAVALLAPGRSFAQEKPVLNTAPPGVRPAPVRPAPAPAPVDTSNVAPTIPVYTPGTAPASQPTPAALPAPSSDSPSGLELPGREQERKAAQQHAEQYTKLFVYSGVGLGYSSIYGSSTFNFSISPAIGYRITDRFAIGPGISYAYNNYGFDVGNGQSTHIGTSNFGVKVFAQLMVIDNFFVHAEYETTKAQLLAVDNNGYLTGGTVSRQVQTPLLGVGYRSQISNRAAADIVLLYNFQDNYNSIYPNPVIRFNFLFNIGR